MAKPNKMSQRFVGLILSTPAPAGEVVSWLQAHCRNGWDLHVRAADPNGVSRKFMILFEDEDDHMRFSKGFSAA